MRQKISLWLLKTWGWTILNNYPVHYRKAILIGMPHTSTLDTPLSILLREALGMHFIKFMIKHTAFRPPFGFIFYWLGGYPVDRTQSKDYVQSIVDIFNQKKEFAIAVAPEGTRKKVRRLKTGFYYIAKGANIPIVMVKADYGKMEISFSDFFPTADKEADFQKIADFYKGVKGKNSELDFDFSDF